MCELCSLNCEWRTLVFKNENPAENGSGEIPTRGVSKQSTVHLDSIFRTGVQIYPLRVIYAEK